MTVSELRETLRDTIAPEANHLLTERPNRPNAPGDFGWFCREHCIVAHSVLKALGHPVDIICGDISIFYGGRKRLSTTGTASDEHWWCSSPVFPVLDLSMTLKHFSGAPVCDGVVLREGPNGEFTVIVDAEERAPCPDYDFPTILYTPFPSQPELNIEPAAGFIAAAIAMHILDVIRGVSQSYKARPQQGALNEIARKYPTAMRDVSRAAPQN